MVMRITYKHIIDQKDELPFKVMHIPPPTEILFPNALFVFPLKIRAYFRVLLRKSEQLVGVDVYEPVPERCFSRLLEEALKCYLGVTWRHRWATGSSLKHGQILLLKPPDGFCF